MGLLDNKVILVTGAGNGIGREHAMACAAEGAKIVVNDLGGTMDGSGSDDAAASKVANEIKAAGGEAIANFDSVTDSEGCARMVKAAMDTWGRLDGIVNNAGILRDVTFKKMEKSQWDLVVDVHLNGTKNVTEAALSALFETAEKHGHCAIINTTSYSGMIGNFGQSNYAAAKAGIYGFTRVLSMELRKYGITANCLAPIAKTRMTDSIEMVEDEWTPAQISPVVVFLASELSKGVTGRVFGIQGQRIHVYEVQMNDGVEKPGTDLWTAQEISDRLGDITAFAQPEAASGGGGSDVVSAVFAHFPAGFRTGKLPDWSSTIQWVVKGGSDQTVIIKDDTCTVKAGLEGTATCTVKTDKDTLVAMFKGELDSTKAFMTGKAVADNMGDLMKMAQVFDFDAIGAAYLAAGGGEEAPAGDPVDEAFSYTSEAYLADKAGDFACTIHFVIKGANDKTIICGEGKARAEDGLVGTPDCTINTDAETITGILTNTTDPQKAFMKGKISADNMGVLMKFAMYFKFEKPEDAAKPAAATEAAPADSGPKQWPIGKTYDGGYAFVRPEQAEAYAAATNDDSAAYKGDDAIAPHMLHTRLFKDVMFQIATDPELELDLLRLVHGEHDATFHLPLKPWDLVQVRARLEAVEEKSSGTLVVSKLFGFVDGALAVECKTAYFIRGAKKPSGDGEKKKAPKAAPPAPPAPDFEAPFSVDDDQSYRYAEASLDDNPIHVDPDTAKAAGLPNVILHGLCTMAMSGSAIVNSQADGDARRLKRLGVRFARPVLNGSKLTTQGWNTDDGTQFIVKDDNGNVVIANGVAELR